MFGFGKKPQKPEPPAKTSAKPAADPAPAMKPLFDPPPQPAAPPPQAAAPAPPPPQSAPTPPQPAPAPPQPAAAAPQPAPRAMSADGDWRSLSITSFTPQDLQITQQQADEAVMKARSESDRGAPFGGALWGALNLVTQNRQYVDDLVDELPNEAFGLSPSPQFGIIARCWSRAIRAESRPEWHTFKQLAMAAGWRPGDINAARLHESLAGEPAFLSKTRHPLGLDLLPENLVLSPMETAVFQHIFETFKKIEASQQAEAGRLQ